MPLKTVGLFALGVLTGLCACWTRQDIGRDEILRKLNSLKDDCRVSINGKPVPNSEEVITALKTLDWLSAHHSNPTRNIDIEITDHAPRVLLRLGRDSGDPREYWVFWPKYLITANNEIGRIRTAVFDAY